MPVRVLYVVSSLVLGGPTRQLYYLCKHGSAAGTQPTVLTLSPNPHSNLEHDFRTLGMDRIPLDLGRLQGMMSGARQVNEAIARIRPDVIHTSGIRSDRLVQGLGAETPHVLTLRNYAWDDYPKKFGKALGSLMAFNHMGTARRARHPVACSPALARRLAGEVPQITMIPNGVDTDVFRVIAHEERCSLKQDLGFSPDKPLVVTVGALIQRKRPLALLQAYLASNSAESSELVFVGEGPLREQLEALAEGNPGVSFSGLVSNVQSYLNAADLLVSTSASEGLPNSVLEAMSCGVPVLLSDIDAHRQLDVEAAGAGRLVDSAVVRSISTALDEMLATDSSGLREKARELAVSRFSAKTMAQTYAALYESLL